MKERSDPEPESEEEIESSVLIYIGKINKKIDDWKYGWIDL